MIDMCMCGICVYTCVWVTITFSPSGGATVATRAAYRAVATPPTKKLAPTELLDSMPKFPVKKPRIDVKGVLQAFVLRGKDTVR